MGIPVLLLSALNEVDDKITGFDLGANDYLSKPFSTKELIARVKVMLKENVVDDTYLQFQDILLNKRKKLWRVRILNINCLNMSVKFFHT